MTVNETSEYLNVKPSTIYQWAKVGGIPHFKLGKMIRFKREEIDTWMENHRGESIDVNKKAKEILKRVRGSKMDVDSVVKKVIEEVKGSRYNLNHGKSDRIRGLGKEAKHGAL